MMNLDELKAQVALGEDGRRQFKQDMTNADSLAAEMAAFSNTGGGTPSGAYLTISAWAWSNRGRLLMFSHFTNSSISRKRRWRSASCSASVGKSSGWLLGSSTIWAKSTARHAARGRRAHHRCNVLGWPWRMDFSRADSLLMASRGRATSISFLGWGIGSGVLF